jgi:hypothetical protein
VIYHRLLPVLPRHVSIGKNAPGYEFTFFFLQVATSTPESVVLTPRASAEDEKTAAATSKAKAGGTDWRILRTKPALALGLFHLASDIGAPCSIMY